MHCRNTPAYITDHIGSERPGKSCLLVLAGNEMWTGCNSLRQWLHYSYVGLSYVIKIKSNSKHYFKHRTAGEVEKKVTSPLPLPIVRKHGIFVITGFHRCFRAPATSCTSRYLEGDSDHKKEEFSMHS